MNEGEIARIMHLRREFSEPMIPPDSIFEESEYSAKQRTDFIRAQWNKVQETYSPKDYSTLRRILEDI